MLIIMDMENGQMSGQMRGRMREDGPRDDVQAKPSAQQPEWFVEARLAEVHACDDRRRRKERERLIAWMCGAG